MDSKKLSKVRVSGYKITEHAYKRMLQRKISIERIAQAFKFGSCRLEKDGKHGQIHHDLRVIFNPHTKTIVTLFQDEVRIAKKKKQYKRKKYQVSAEDLFI